MDRDELFLQWAVQNNFLSREQALWGLQQRRNGSGLGTPIESWLVQVGLLDLPRVQFLVQRAQQLRSQSGSQAPNGSPQAPTPPPSSGVANSQDSQKSGLENALRARRSLLEPGQRLGSNTVISEIARGGMGAVFRARRDDGLELALKVMLAEAADEKAIRRFEREIEAQKSLEHPNIVALFESGQEGSRLFYTMELATGGSLADLIPKVDATSEASLAAPEPHQPQKSMHEKIAILAEVADAMGFAHERGIYHRDLKPANVLLSAQGRPKISDFGLAKSLLPEDKLTNTGATVGTPSYMAPEQVRGDIQGTDHRCDVWALGIILYELLSGSRPFRGEHLPQIYEGILNRAHEPLSKLCPEAAGSIEDIVSRCLEKDPVLRYPSARQLAHDLNTWLEKGEVSVQGRSTASQIWRGIKRRERRVLLPLSLLLLLTIGLPGAWLLFKNLRIQAAAKAREQAIERTLLAFEKSSSLSDARLNEARQALEIHDDSAASQALESVETELNRALSLAKSLPEDDLRALQKHPKRQAWLHARLQLLDLSSRQAIALQRPLNALCKLRSELYECLLELPYDAQAKPEQLSARETFCRLAILAGGEAEALDGATRALQASPTNSTALRLAVAALALHMERPALALQLAEALTSEESRAIAFIARLRLSQRASAPQDLSPALAVEVSLQDPELRSQAELRAEQLEAELPQLRWLRACALAAMGRHEDSAALLHAAERFSENADWSSLRNLNHVLALELEALKLALPEQLASSPRSLQGRWQKLLLSFALDETERGSSRGLSFDALENFAREHSSSLWLNQQRGLWLYSEATLAFAFDSAPRAELITPLLKGASPAFASLAAGLSAPSEAAQSAAAAALVDQPLAEVALRFLARDSAPSSQTRAELAFDRANDLAAAIIRRARMHEVFWRCARRAEDLSARLQLAELAIRLSPWRPDPWLIALRAALDGEADLGKGLPWARAAIRLYPKDREILALALRAKASFGDDQSLKETQAQLQGAAPLFDQASKLDRAHFHLACATSLERLGALDEALKDCRRALELNPQLNPARLLLATVLKKSGKTQEAEANLREHNIRTDPNETEIYLLTRQGPDRS